MLRWDNIYSLDSLLIATTQTYTKSLFQKYKTYTVGADDRTLYDWARNNKANLIRLGNQLRDRRFQYQPLRKSIIKFPSKTREVYVATWRDKLVDAMLNTELNRALDHIQSPQSYAYRLAHGGVDICQTNIAKALFSYDQPIYIVKRDITNYYPSINKEILLEKVARYVPEDDYLYRLIRNRIHYKTVYQGQELHGESGIPFGSPISCFLANLYLNDLDHVMAKFSIHYFRYADDFLMFGPNKEAVKGARDVLEQEINKLGVTFKTSHTHDICLFGDDNEFKRAVAFKHLGLYYKDNKLVGISREKVRKILNIFKRAIKRRRGGLERLKTPEARAKFIIKTINDVVVENIRPVAVIDYYLKHMTDENQLREMDKMVAELVLAKATKRGYRKSNYKIISFKKLREMGLPSFIHRMRLLKHGHIESNFFDFRVRKKNRFVMGGREKRIL